MWLAVAAIGGAGSVARLAGSDALGRTLPPLGTLAVNLLGAFALGVLSGAGVSGDARLLAGTALLGSFTTFSTWMHELVLLHRSGLRQRAAGLLAGALLGGLAAVCLGHWLGGTF